MTRGSLRGLAALVQSFALFSPPAQRRRHESRAASPQIEGLESKALLSLTAITSTAGFPFKAIGQLTITYPNNKVFYGSGVLVDSYHVLTAGHNTYSSKDGGWAKTIKFTPLMTGGSAPYGSAFMTYERTYTSFINYNKKNPSSTATDINDIGLLTLDRKMGDKVGWMSYGYDDNNSRFAPGTIFNSAGFPAAGGYNGKTEYYSSGKIAGLSGDGRAIRYSQSEITTYGGQSGGPVWLYKTSDGSRVIYGIHVGGSGKSNSLNFATRITKSIYTQIGSWRTADKASTKSASLHASAAASTSPGKGTAGHASAAILANQVAYAAAGHRLS
ncbi:MAG: trypsin-like serine protease [Isosphaeraceae bacterium]